VLLSAGSQRCRPSKGWHGSCSGRGGGVSDDMGAWGRRGGRGLCCPSAPGEGNLQSAPVKGRQLLQLGNKICWERLAQLGPEGFGQMGTREDGQASRNAGVGEHERGPPVCACAGRAAKDNANMELADSGGLIFDWDLALLTDAHARLRRSRARALSYG